MVAAEDFNMKIVPIIWRLPTIQMHKSKLETLKFWLGICLQQTDPFMR